MTFKKVTTEEIVSTRKKKNSKLHDDLQCFLSSNYRYAMVDDNEQYYNNNNDMRRAIQSCITNNDLPIVVFMRNGIVYVEKL